MPSRDDIKAPNKKKKISLVQYVILGATLLWLVLMYWIAAPSGWLQHLFWFVSAAIPFIPAILLLRAIPRLRNRIGGILLLVLFAVLMLLIQELYMWVSIAYLVVGTIFVVKNLTDIVPRLYVVTLEEADGTTTTETHALSNDDDIANLEVNAIDADYKSRGYTKK